MRFRNKLNLEIDMVIIEVVIVLLAGFVIHSIIPTYYNKWLNRSVVKSIDGKKRIMLTFDDGPDPRYIYSLIDILDRHGVKAIFFMVGQNAEKNPDIVRDILKRGHRIGIHSWQHKNAMLYSYPYTKKDFENSHRIMVDLNIDTRLYRPPWGHINIFSNFFAKKYGMKIVYWNVMAEDWEAKATVETIYSKIMDRVKDGSIICLHDAGENSGGAPQAPIKMISGLDRAIGDLIKDGYRFEVDFD